jgi:hypothetical protein
MPFARGEHRAVRLPDSRVLIIGGEDETNVFPVSVYAFRPDTETFAPFALLPGRLLDGRLLVAGGVTGPLSSDATQTTELVSDTAQRRDGPAMVVRRRDHTVTRLNNGKLLVVGGLGTNLWPLASAEIYE